MSTTSRATAQVLAISGKFPVICGVYCITHIATGKRYIGQSIDCLRRMLEHGRFSATTPIGDAVRLYGRDAFHYEILSVVPRHELLKYEAGWIEILDTVVPKGFNQVPGATSRVAFDATGLTSSQREAKRKRVKRQIAKAQAAGAVR